MATTVLILVVGFVLLCGISAFAGFTSRRSATKTAYGELLRGLRSLQEVLRREVPEETYEESVHAYMRVGYYESNAGECASEIRGDGHRAHPKVSPRRCHLDRLDFLEAGFFLVLVLGSIFIDTEGLRHPPGPVLTTIPLVGVIVVPAAAILAGIRGLTHRRNETKEAFEGLLRELRYAGALLHRRQVEEQYEDNVRAYMRGGADESDARRSVNAQIHDARYDVSCPVCRRRFDEHGGKWCACPVCGKRFKPSHACKPVVYQTGRASADQGTGAV